MLLFVCEDSCESTLREDEYNHSKQICLKMKGAPNFILATRIEQKYFAFLGSALQCISNHHEALPHLLREQESEVMFVSASELLKMNFKSQRSNVA